MMVSSHLKNSRITLPMGSSALGSCESCSAALMDIPPSEYKREGEGRAMERLRPGCLYPTESPAALVPYRGQKVGGGRERGARA